MSTSGTISNLQQALNCAGKCDCCDKLQSQINALKAEIAGIPRVNEAAIINTAKIQAKDLIMPLVFSYIASQLKPIQELIRALENSLFKLSGQIANLLGRLAKVEATVINALKTAANALGVSNEAIRRIAALLTRLAPLLNVLGTILNLLGVIGTLETLGARIDAVENSVQAVANSVSSILGKLLGLQNRIAGVEGGLSSIRAIAQDALSIGSQATSIGRDARSAAGLAQNTANQAQTTADGAVRNALQANDNATTAVNKANQAQRIAEQAKQIGSQALNKAGEALGIGLTALSLYQLLKLRPGIPGRPGRDGLNGRPGRDGLNGRPGRDGRSGRDGLQGAPGITQVIQIPGVPGRDGRNGLNGLPGRAGRDGLNGRDGVDAVPYNDSGLKAFIAAQHNQTRVNSVVQHNQTRTTILTPVMAALAPILALLKQIYDAVMAVSNAAILALLNVINTKLGNQLVGGIAGKLTRFSDWLQLDRALNVLILAATIHNAAMLTNDIGQTLIGALNNVLQLIGLKKDDGSAFDIGSVISSSIENLIKGAIGADNYTVLTTAWAKANRVYQASVNILNSFQSLSSVILTGLEMTAGKVAKIGNALRNAGEVLETAYGWMNPQPKFNRVTQTLESLQNGASTIQMVTQVPLDIINATTELTTATTELTNAIKQDENPANKGKESPEPEKLKADQATAKLASAGLEILDLDLEADE